MAVNRTQVIEAVNRLYKIHINWYVDDILDIYDQNLPRAMTDIAAWAFMGQWESNEDLDTLRSGMLQLNKFGYIG